MGGADRGEEILLLFWIQNFDFKHSCKIKVGGGERGRENPTGDQRGEGLKNQARPRILLSPTGCSCPSERERVPSLRFVEVSPASPAPRGSFAPPSASKEGPPTKFT